MDDGKMDPVFTAKVRAAKPWERELHNASNIEALGCKSADTHVIAGSVVYRT